MNSSISRLVLGILVLSLIASPAFAEGTRSPVFRAVSNATADQAVVPFLMAGSFSKRVDGSRPTHETIGSLARQSLAMMVILPIHSDKFSGARDVLRDIVINHKMSVVGVVTVYAVLRSTVKDIRKIRKADSVGMMIGSNVPITTLVYGRFGRAAEEVLEAYDWITEDGILAFGEFVTHAYVSVDQKNNDLLSLSFEIGDQTLSFNIIRVNHSKNAYTFAINSLKLWTEDFSETYAPLVKMTNIAPGQLANRVEFIFLILRPILEDMQGRPSTQGRRVFELNPLTGHYGHALPAAA